MKKKYLVIIILIFLLASAGYVYNKETNSPITNDKVIDNKITKVKQVENLKNITSYFGELLSTSKGKANGIAQASFKNNQYQLVARFQDLPDLQGTDFYEGWIVRKGLKFDVISTGKATKENGEFINTYSTNIDLTDHDFYVLTLEPNDGDPAPAEHILEGTLKLK